MFDHFHVENDVIRPRAVRLELLGGRAEIVDQDADLSGVGAGRADIPL